jgi:hypothetical protein
LCSSGGGSSNTVFHTEYVFRLLIKHLL